MSLLTDKDFVEGLPSALDLFSMPPYQTSVFQHYYVDVRPVSQITDSSPVEFQISNSGSDYVDLKRSRLHVKLKVSHSDGTVLGKDEHVAPVNLFMQALWSQVAVYLQGQLVSSANNHYPYKAYIQTLLNYGEDAKKSQLQSQLFYKDTAETQADIESTDPITGINSGLSDRGTFIADSKTVTMEGPLCEDIFNIGRYLVNGVDITVKLFRTSSPFCLMSGKSGQEYKIDLQDIYFKICKLKINSALILTHNKLFEKSNTLYPFTKTEVKISSIASSQQSYVWDSVFQSQCPNRLVVGFVNGDGVNGSYTKNPFNFQSSFVKTVALYLDGVSVPGRPIEGDDVSAYVNLFEGLNNWNQNSGNYIERTEFAFGNGLFVFSLKAVFVDSNYLILLKSGNLRLEVQFKSALTKTVSCIVYGEFPSLIEIDQTRNVIVR
ncbi:uncharacterized protein F54H12.2-like [Gigantopelta aegis]|uniref:uncharacterized protein F54H12.2-like n=1 Tax=Gigantopelta aegis TaxID=1735272 RepID=UPI001B88B229|nr:uncharacterized protein F54H12.2-like [Gigantopelta aegis]